MADLEDAGRRGADETPGDIVIASRPASPARGERWLAPLIILALLILWETSSRLGLFSQLFFPAPTKILATLWDLTISSDLTFHLAATLKRLLLGLVLGCIPGVIIGLAMGWSHTLYAAIDPIMSALHPIPKISILPLFLIIFGIGDLSKIALIAVTCFFPMAINSMTGVQQISRTYFDVAHNYGASRLQTFMRVVLPGSLLNVMTGLRLALNNAFLIAIAAELLSAQEGLGTMISFAWRTMRVTEMYAVLIVIAMLGILFANLVQWITSRVVPWQELRRKVI